MSDLKQKLDSDIPVDQIETREQSGRKLSYLTGAYVINRLNQVLGQGNWGFAVKSISKVYEGTVEQRSGTVFATSYLAAVALTVKISDSTITMEDVGYGDGTDKTNPGKAHELGAKEAVTDALKRTAKNLGISMGLGLYFKDGDYTVDNSGTAVATQQPQLSTPTGPVKGNESVADTAGTQAADKKTKVDPRATIRSAYNVLTAQKKVAKDEFASKYLGGKSSKDLTDTEANNAIVLINKDFKELNLI